MSPVNCRWIYNDTIDLIKPGEHFAAAIRRLHQLSCNGQPYLIQLIGHALVTRYNRLMAEQAITAALLPERGFETADVAAAIDAPEFYRDGDAYFSGIWRQAESDRIPTRPQPSTYLAQLDARGRARGFGALRRWVARRASGP